MTNASMINGKAYEFACLSRLKDVVSKIRPVTVIDNSSYHVAKGCWDSLIESKQTDLAISAEAGVKALISLEPKIVEDGTDMLELSLQEDSRGESGDVRDILVVRKPIDWEIGISVKNNHHALKHSRLSKKLDFGQKWLNIPCSNDYFQEIKPHFEELKKLHDSKVCWRDLDGKHEKYYIPVLDAFMKELRRQYEVGGEVVANSFARYLLGSFDFYKLISNPSRHSTSLISFNLYGTLGKASKSLQPEHEVPLVELPNRIFNIGLKPNSTDTVEVHMDNGWEITLRIHSASSIVESSLKFDVQITGMPQSLFVIDTPWRI